MHSKKIQDNNMNHSYHLLMHPTSDHHSCIHLVQKVRFIGDSKSEFAVSDSLGRVLELPSEFFCVKKSGIVVIFRPFLGLLSMYIYVVFSFSKCGVVFEISSTNDFFVEKA